MAKHTQTIRPQIADELLECVWPLYEIGAKRVKLSFWDILHNMGLHLAGRINVQSQQYTIAM